MINKTFIVSQLKEDAILGMPFLKRHMCHIDFNKWAVVMVGRERACVNRFGRPLVGGGGAGGAALHCTWALSGYSLLQSEL